MAQGLRRLFAAGAILVAVFIYGNRWLGSNYTVPVIMYHQVEFASEPRADTVSPPVFAGQMAFLQGRGYKVIPLAELVEGTRSGRRWERKEVVLTFDDGYENNFTRAFPVLTKYRFPATLFISPDFMGRPGFLTWEQALIMQKGTVAYGSHGMTQAYLPEISRSLQEYEIKESKRILEQRLGTRMDFFCYPVGGFSDEIKDQLRQAGYQAGLATNRGSDRYNRDRYEIKRIRLSDKDRSAFVLWAKLSGYYNLFRRLKRPY